MVRFQNCPKHRQVSQSTALQPICKAQILISSLEHVCGSDQPVWDKETWNKNGAVIPAQRGETGKRKIQNFRSLYSEFKASLAIHQDCLKIKRIKVGVAPVRVVVHISSEECQTAFQSRDTAVHLAVTSKAPCYPLPYQHLLQTACGPWPTSLLCGCISFSQLLSLFPDGVLLHLVRKL